MSLSLCFWMVSVVLCSGWDQPVRHRGDCAHARTQTGRHHDHWKRATAQKRNSWYARRMHVFLLSWRQRGRANSGFVMRMMITACACCVRRIRVLSIFNGEQGQSHNFVARSIQRLRFIVSPMPVTLLWDGVQWFPWWVMGSWSGGGLAGLLWWSSCHPPHWLADQLNWVLPKQTAVLAAKDVVSSKALLLSEFMCCPGFTVMQARSTAREVSKGTPLFCDYVESWLSVC